MIVFNALCLIIVFDYNYNHFLCIILIIKFVLYLFNCIIDFCIRHNYNSFRGYVTICILFCIFDALYIEIANI